MPEWLTGVGGVISALFANDSWMLKQALAGPASWTAGLIFTLVGGFAVLLLYRIRLIEKYLEPAIMVVSYLTIGGIIFAGVLQRFYFSGQPPWSTTLPPFLFLIMAWFGCSYNVKLRTHLAFSEFRTAMPRIGQISCLVMDAVLWIVFSWIVITTSTRVVVNSAANFQIMLGTDNVMQWWFLLTVPVAFIALTGRVLENLITDLRNYRSGAVMIKQAVIGGD
ncbi:TRAP transporter small permease [Aestuariibius sp. HNIBRBA575]|uniref:TRAP transporter small permease n=1 Tax=Aestuariibius sp. HNIBRBA575 TaxID=3233343 RepID=UPI0034A29EF3